MFLSDYKVKTGERIEILTSNQQNKGPSKDWLSIVRTGEARNKIRTWFKKERREENIEEGKAIVEKSYAETLFVFRVINIMISL